MPVIQNLVTRTPQKFRQRITNWFWQTIAKRLRKHLMSMPYIHGPRDRFAVGKNVILNNATINTRGGVVRIEDHVMFGHNVSVLTGVHDYRQRAGERIAIDDAGRDITIERGAWIASNAILIGPCTIGEEAVVAAGSVVTKDVAPRTIVAGNPARVIRYILPPQVVEQMKAAG
jgi:acetyltransferase-like isoleucine patch superfamily enzyme